MMDFVLNMMDFVLNMMDFVLNMMDFVLKMVRVPTLKMDGLDLRLTHSSASP